MRKCHVGLLGGIVTTEEDCTGDCKKDVLFVKVGADLRFIMVAYSVACPKPSLKSIKLWWIYVYVAGTFMQLFSLKIAWECSPWL